ncbi:MAG: mechanosensitive ion channel family protein, partial [Paludibacter sp.]|nr:mechanosensitive ion channel family protein [Paludibacter sp.]
LVVLSWLLKAIKWFIILLLVYLLLPLVFSIFPFTRGWADTLLNFIWKPFSGIMLSVWEYLPNLFTIIVIIVVFKYTIRFVRYLFGEIEAGKLKVSGFHEDWSMPTFSIVKFLLYAFMFILIFPYLPGSDSGIFQGVSVFLGLLVSLGSSSAISNMVAGLVITYMRPFKEGDRIQLGDVTGIVLEKTLLVTRLRTVKNEEITIPNSAVLSGNTTNYSAVAKSEGLILYTSVTIGYDVPWRDVHAALLEAASRTDKLITGKQAFVLQTSLDDFYVAYQLNVFSSESEVVAPIYSQLHQNIQDVFAERGIEIMSPHYRAERDGSDVAIPKVPEGGFAAKH